MPIANKRYLDLVDKIGGTVLSARKNALIAINNELTMANWNIGRHIVEFEEKGNETAEYGSSLLSNLARDLRTKYGKGFSKSNIYTCRLFYLRFPIFQTVSGKLSWSVFTNKNISKPLIRHLKGKINNK